MSKRYSRILRHFVALLMRVLGLEWGTGAFYCAQQLCSQSILVLRTMHFVLHWSHLPLDTNNALPIVIGCMHPTPTHNLRIKGFAVFE